MRFRLRTLLTRVIEIALIVAVIAVFSDLLLDVSRQSAESQRQDAVRKAAKE